MATKGSGSSRAEIDESARSAPLSLAIRHLSQGRLGDAEHIVRTFLGQRPDDVAALCVLADLAVRAGLFGEATSILGRAVDLAPDYDEARLALAKALARSGDVPQALAHLDRLLAGKPAHRQAGTLRLALLSQIGDHEAAMAGHAALLDRTPREPQLWLNYGNELKTIGHSKESITAYRHALALDDRTGEAWWGLANLKTGVLTDHDVRSMRASLATLPPLDRRAIPIEFALGRALEDAGEHEQAFAHYRAGNKLQRATRPYDATATTREVDHAIACFTRGFFGDRLEAGCQRADPIFILGMPRSGSTLVEQILASHSSVEGTAELPLIPILVNRLLAEHRRFPDLTFPQVLRLIPIDQLQRLGEDYLRAAIAYRRTSRPFFIDKLPNNWANIGLIQAILPRARIIDTRRQAVACCFANYKQYMPAGQSFANDLADMASYFRDYVRLMAHCETVLPGRIIHVDHEQLVADPEQGIRMLLDRLDLSFEAGCLAPHDNPRPVRTASAEQVRRPISSIGVAQWRNFEPWLGELKAALGELA